MPNMKLLALALLALSVAYVFSDNTGGAGTAYNNVAAGNVSSVAALEGQKFCPGPGKNGTDCGEGSFAHYYDCCGNNNAECCFALQMWVYIVLGVIVLISIISTVVGIVCCCCKK
ncbi:unnamed protein product [Caenorhabditis sp. 36 PRJEB53466]|nr:unnamed protein product [Caenorhabditis sp. 36 PRJEB53466]